MTARKPRPVVRVVIEVYPKDERYLSPEARSTIRKDAERIADRLYCKEDDYRRPRVVSVRRVRGSPHVR